MNVVGPEYMLCVLEAWVPGTACFPEDCVSRYHQGYLEVFGAIWCKGLKLSYLLAPCIKFFFLDTPGGVQTCSCHF